MSNERASFTTSRITTLSGCSADSVWALWTWLEPIQIHRETTTSCDAEIIFLPKLFILLNISSLQDQKHGPGVWPIGTALGAAQQGRIFSKLACRQAPAFSWQLFTRLKIFIEIAIVGVNLARTSARFSRPTWLRTRNALFVNNSSFNCLYGHNIKNKMKI